MSDSDQSKHTKKSTKKETYSAEEKKMLMERLDEERRAHDKAMKSLGITGSHYTEHEKDKILDKINEERLSKRKRAEIEKRRTENKEVYIFSGKEYYKFTNMEREYYIEVAQCHKVYARPELITLYYRTFNEMQKKEVLLKTEVYSDKFFISYNTIRVYFKSYALEDKR